MDDGSKSPGGKGGAPERSSYNGLRNAVMEIKRSEGFRGFYKGVTPNVAGAGTAWGFYFLL